MTNIEALILGVLQGITEFLPISSSGHLIIGEELLNLHVEELKSFDVAVHMATLLAVAVYFWRDLVGLFKAFFKMLSGNIDKNDPFEKLLLYVVIATLPVVFAGLLFEDITDSIFRNMKMVALAMIVTGLIFILGEYVYKKRKKSELNLSKALIIGIAQAVAIIPGVSRSGSTIVAGIFQGIPRAESARFSFLLGMPAMFGAGILTAFNSGGNNSAIEVMPMVIGFLSAFIFGLLSIFFLMKFLKKHTLLFFAVYVILLSVGILLF